MAHHVAWGRWYATKSYMMSGPAVRRNVPGATAVVSWDRKPTIVKARIVPVNVVVLALAGRCMQHRQSLRRSLWRALRRPSLWVAGCRHMPLLLIMPLLRWVPKPPRPRAAMAYAVLSAVPPSGRYGKSGRRRSAGPAATAGDCEFSRLDGDTAPVAPRHPDRYDAECASLRPPSRTQPPGPFWLS
jgi:hypothetical protein